MNLGRIVKVMRQSRNQQTAAFFQQFAIRRSVHWNTVIPALQQRAMLVIMFHGGSVLICPKDTATVLLTNTLPATEAAADNTFSPIPSYWRNKAGRVLDQLCRCFLLYRRVPEKTRRSEKRAAARDEAEGKVSGYKQVLAHAVVKAAMYNQLRETAQKSF